MITEERQAELAHTEEYLSQSRISRAGKCLYQYKLVEVDKLVRRWNPAPLRRGTLVHSGYEAALLWDWARRHLASLGEYGAERWEFPLPTKAWEDMHLTHMLNVGETAIRAKQAEWLSDERVAPHVDEFMRETAERLVDDSVRIFRRSFAALGVHTGKWKTVAVPGTLQPFIEYPMAVDFPGWAGIRGMVDWVAEDENGHVWIWDFKTRKAVKPYEYDRLQLQAPMYQMLIRETFGVNLVGSITYQIRAAIRKRPKLNTRKTKQPNGEMAVGMARSAITTDWPTYRQALLDEGLDPDMYLDMRDKLPASFDVINRYYRGTREADEVWNTVLDTVDIMETAHRTDSFPRNINPFTCGACSHRTYCEADLQDEDLEALRNTVYMREDEDNRYASLTIDED